MTRTSWRVFTVLALALGALSFAATSSAHDGHHDGHHGDKSHNEHHGDGNNFNYSTTLTSPDSGTCRNVWANDALKRTYTVHRSGDGSYTLTTRDRGTFTTVAGQSPEACDTSNTKHGATVTAGIQGRVGGFISGKVIGGTFNPNATCAATCDTTAFVSAFFGPTATRSCSIPQSCKYIYVYTAKDESLKYHVWIDAGRADSAGPLKTKDHGDIATA
jgi:hypothetical protein